MGADSPRGRGKQPAWKAAAGGPDPRGPQYKWKKEDAAPPGTGGRRAKQLLLLGGTLACLGGIVWLILYLWPTPQLCIVAVSANPADDAARLDAPLDLYGWQTAKEFLQHGRERAEKATHWIGRAPTPPDDKGNPIRLPETKEGLPDWANRLKPFDPLVIYVGLHGGTDGSGRPFLFTGGGNRLLVADLLTALATDPLKSKKKVLILDCGRLPSDPVYGQITDDFAARVKALNQQVQADPNLVVMCGASDGQRGWESEELRLTSLGRAVLRSLRGDIDTGGTSVVTAQALFESARQKTLEWAQHNRPTAQEPFLLPEGKDGFVRAAEIKLGARPDAPPDDLKPNPAPLPPALKQNWAEHDRLVGQTPGPAAYAPRAWRRYRELLLRYEQAVRVGEQPTADTLTTALTTAHDAIVRAAVGKLDSARGSIALWAAVNAGGTIPTGADLTTFPRPEEKRIAYAARVLKQFSLDQLAREATLLRNFDPPDRPAEAHLPVMVQDFYANVLGKSAEAPPAEWSTVFTVRLDAERAAAGLPVAADADPGSKVAVYPERIWPMTRPFVLVGDVKRRQAEDALFASDPKEHAQAVGWLTEARKSYADAATIAQAARTAFAVRDAVLADLPFLTRWYAGRYASATDAADLIDLWDKVHALAAELDGLAAEAKANDDAVKRARAAGKLADTIRERYAKYRDEFLTAAKDAREDAALQAKWWAAQQLLSVPLIPTEDREQVLTASRSASADMLADTNPVRKTAPEAAKTEAKTAAAFRGKLARAVLGDKLLDAQHEDHKTLPKADILDRDLTLMTTSDPWTGLAAQVGAGLGDHLAELSKAGLAPTAVPDARAELASRSAVPFGAASGWEPAAANHRLRWRAYLTDLAGRTADDHWYDERQSPYFKAVADRYVADANRLTEELRGLTPPGAAGSWGGAAPDKALADKLKAPSLTAHDLAAITWTSEQDRTVPFNLGPLPKDYPITGRAVAVGRFGGLAPIRAVGEALSRPLLPIPGASLGLPAELKLDVGAEEKTRRDCLAACTVYFRGQRPTQQVTIHLNCKPELVIAEPPPAGEDRNRMVAVRADRNVELGSVVILLDYSGSMKWGLDGKWLLGDTQENNSKWRNGPSRFRHAMTALDKLLGELPKGTPLRIRVFSDKENETGSRVVFGTGKGDDQPLVTWESNQDHRYKDLVATLDGITPQGVTPLAQSIIDAANNDFAKLGGGSKTLLVLTDGAEDDGQNQNRNAQAQANFIAGRAKALANGLAGQNVALHVVQFAVSPSEQKEAGDLFRPLSNLPGELVQLWHADNRPNLLQALLDAIRPKLKLLDRNGGRPDDFPQTGLPSRVDDRGEPPYSTFKPYWSKWITDNTEGPFKVWAYPNRLPNPTDLVLRPGERMLLGFGKQGHGILVRRELYADYILNHKARRDDKLWALSVPDSKVDNQENFRFHSLAFLEKVPLHLRGKVGDGPLEFAPPELTWWQVTPVAEKGESLPPTGTVRVTRSYGYPAPGWGVTVEGWPHNPVRPAEIKVWVADAPKVNSVPCRPDDSKTIITPTGDSVEMRAKLETVTPVGAAPVECLVVRFTLAKGKPIHVRPADDTAVTYAEHRYYGDAGAGAAGMTAYTAIFALPVDKLKSNGVNLKLMEVQPALTADNLMTLTLPKPEPGKALALDPKPQPFDSKK